MRALTENRELVSGPSVGLPDTVGGHLKQDINCIRYFEQSYLVIGPALEQPFEARYSGCFRVLRRHYGSPWKAL